MGWFQGSAVAAALVVLAVSATGCGGRASAPDASSNGGGAAGAAPNELPNGGASQAGAPPVVEMCPVVPLGTQTAGAIITFQTQPTLFAQPMVFGEPNPLPGGGSLTPLNFRFYISDVRLVRADGGLTPTDLVTSAGMPEPYGVHLFNAEDPASTAWSIRAKAGSYLGLRFALGLADGCNASDPSQRIGALTTDSQMTWTRGFGYLFLLFEARIDGPADAGAGGASEKNPSDPVAVIRMGGLPGLIFAPTVSLSGPLAVPETGTLTRRVSLEMEQIFSGANSTEPFTDPGPPNPPLGGLNEGAALRHAAPRLPIFMLEP